MKAGQLRGHRLGWFSPIFCLLLGFAAPSASAQDSYCAEVKIEIKQELTLERQAFDAHMRINNGLDTLPLDNVAITVNFADENGDPVLASSDPNHTTAKFFIRVDTLEGISDIDGFGQIQPQTSADIHWLIIPAPGAGGPLSSGTLYFVGATLTYDLGGEQEIVEVTPDSIIVKPMPRLTLDYFLTEEVYADDAFTAEIEPAEPFTLGVRVTNTGNGPAKDVTIESAQPKIVENEQGLLIGFELLGSTINDQPSTPSLLVNLGDIPSNGATVGRWIMQTSLSGTFTEFSADFAHADELGGELTSLLEATHSHLLVHDVLVDLPGRDGVRDFLAKDGEVLTVFESESLDTVVTDLSALATFVANGTRGGNTLYTLTVPPTTDFVYVKLPDPHGGAFDIKEVIRADGKRLSGHNAWLSKTRNKDTNGWYYYVNFFDVATPGGYTVAMGLRELGEKPPLLQYIPHRTTHEGKQVSFVVEASDPNGTLPSLTAAPLPNGARFIDQGDNTANFDWTPAINQAGNYAITYTTSDGVLLATRTATIKVNPAWDTDGDGLDDDWERQHFGSLDRDGTGDFDGDGISDLQEYLDGTDPTMGPGPGTPVIQAPALEAETTDLQPTLVVVNGDHSATATVTYDFEVYTDETLTTSVAQRHDVAETLETTTWAVTAALQDNTWHYWRVRAYDGRIYSEWVNGSFFVNTANDAPGAFNISRPQDGAEVDTFQPTLAVTNAVDVDGDVVHYAFEVYTDSQLTVLAAAVTGMEADASGTTSWLVNVPLAENTHYTWRALATDEHGAQTASPLGQFFVNTGNDAPGVPFIVSPAQDGEVATLEVDLVVANAVDPDEDSLSYTFELDTVSTFDSVDKRVSAPITQGPTTTQWSVTGLVENTEYYWRVKATDGGAEGDWSQGRFFVNVENETPSRPTVNNPGNEAWVETRVPALVVNAAQDPDRDRIAYRFELYEDAGLNSIVAANTNETGEWVLASPLTDNTWYFWRAQAEDEHGAASAWTAVSGFFVNDNGFDDPPTLTLLEPATDSRVTANTATIRWQDDDPDSNATISLHYDATAETDVLIIDGLSEDGDGDNDHYVWDVGQLPNGTYSVYAEITDATSSRIEVAPAPITVHFYDFGGFGQPLRDGSIYKLVRVLPVKFELFEKDGPLVTDATPTLTLRQLSAGDVIGEALEVISNSAADVGNTFRFADVEYIFNLATDSYAQGTYRLEVDLGDGSLPRTLDIGFR